MKSPLTASLLTILFLLLTSTAIWANSPSAALSSPQDPPQETATTESQPLGIVGTWRGKLNVGAFELELIFKIKPAEEGDGYTATMDSPDQGAKDIPVGNVTFKDGELELGSEQLGLRIKGKLSEDGKELTCQFEQAGREFPLTLKRSEDDVAARLRPQEPKPPFPYEAIDVDYDNPHAEGVHLAGTLSIPEGDGPFPAVILISGSGPQDRDETIFAHKPFWVIADYLTRRGIAVLRYDDRGVANSTGDHNAATTMDFANDAQAGVEFLAQHDKIDAKHIGLMGHSEGGLIAPIVANRSEHVAFLVLLAGPGVTGEEIIITQTRDIIRALDPTADVDSPVKTIKGFLRIIQEEDDPAEVRKQIAAFAREQLEAESDETIRESLGLSGDLPEELDTREEQVDALVKLSASSAERLLSPWMQFFITFDPRGELTKIKQPVLAINGSNDTQVNPGVNLRAIEAALNEAGNADFLVKQLPELNHLFQTSKTGSTQEYGVLEETFAPSALELVGDWILAHCK